MTNTSYLDATGPIRYGMTNECMFRAVLQRNNYVLKGLICSLLHLNPADVSSVEITNPIELGEAAADDKEFILDINVSLNNHSIINLEMQMAYRKDWRERSLSYLCRSFDQLCRGADYGEVKPTIHIGFLNFSPDTSFEPEFYASYRLLNEKTYTSYSDKFLLRVVNLRQIDLATEEDKANRIDYWARLFTATSWEDIKMITQNDPFLSAASQSLYESNADEIVRQKCRAREEYFKLERAAQRFDDENKALKLELDEKLSIIAEKNSVITEKNQQLAQNAKQFAQNAKQLEQDQAEIAELKRQLAEVMSNR